MVQAVSQSLQLVNVVFVGGFLAWYLANILRRRSEWWREERRRSVSSSSAPSVCSWVSVVCCFAISLLYTCSCVYEYRLLGSFDSKSVSSAVSWISASAAAVYYCRKRDLSRGNYWPLVLILWWIYSGLLSSVYVTFIIIRRLGSKDFHPTPLVGAADIVNIISCALSLVLCSSAIFTSCSGSHRSNELERPLLPGGSRNDSGDFDSAGVWSRLTFQWLNPLFKTGRQQKLELLHIPLVPQSESAEFASSALEASLRKQKTGHLSLPRAILFAVWRSMTINGVIAGINTLASYTGPFLIAHFVNFLSAEHESRTYLYGLILALMLLTAKNVESLTQRQWYFGAQRIGIRIRAGLMVLIYKKCLSIKHSSGMASGKVINLINVDVERIGDFCWYIHGIWLLPVQVFLALAILHWSLGPAPAFAALLSTVLVMVSNTPLANRQERLHSRIMEAKDSRIKATSETLKSMRVLKLHSWEPNFLKRILKLREAESNWLKKYLYTCSAVAFLFWASPTLVSVATFGVCIVMKTPLSAGIVLSALATFRILQEPIYNLPELISMIAQTKVSVDRIKEFIREEDQVKAIDYYHQNICNPHDVAIEIEPGEYAWKSDNPDSKKYAVKIPDKVKILKGWKVAVCGSVGSGKSSFFCSILDEIPRTAGARTKIRGTKAYVPQSAWIQTGTIRDNIVFGRQMYASLYDDVLESCALKQDIALWSDGDLSVVGERGMNLSGGQKQRIQLSRAAYSDADVYFLDDPFSAVDAHTGTHLFKVAWQVFILFLIILGASIWYQTYYITTARELARMVGIRKAPILHHFSESIAGAATIRCFDQQGHFLRRCLGLIDDYSRVAFHNCGTMEWLCVRINFLFNSVFFVVLVILVSLPRSAINPSLAGLVATYGLNLNVLQAWVIWNLCNVENKMISVERILQFSSIPSEAPLVIDDSRPSPEWPSCGTIELENLHVQYKPSLPVVLRGITCTFPGKKKVGIVGRTGSGKSTLIQALFRVVEPSIGRILIDGVDIVKMGLQDLRSRLSIIPQDPILFQGTVRANLDPLQQHSDPEVWDVLKKCHLEEMVRQDQRLLEAPVAEDGENWSVGQRQLVCLARVLLQKRRILVLDEATASIDTATDNLIQKTIRGETQRCTVLTVAHRIPTVIDNDLVLVLDEGKIIEYDSPKVLLDNKLSSFSRLVVEFLRRSSNSSLQ
ncbi:hypothetical protein SAY87_028834 [Trapa incisa]|uniref:ABC-type xenobiotic transporter n=1 Tax=Trapa incisa TaxID=236973 RepID=A0AAN7L2J2_9MYRT|nr:hypothetical protein SAY87_028834 [Trapa incisa]